MTYLVGVVLKWFLGIVVKLNPKKLLKKKIHDTEMSMQAVYAVQSLYNDSNSSQIYLLLIHNGKTLDKLSVLYSYPIAGINKVLSPDNIHFSVYTPLPKYIMKDGMYRCNDIRTCTDSGLKSMMLRYKYRGVYASAIKNKYGMPYAILISFYESPSDLSEREVATIDTYCDIIKSYLDRLAVNDIRNIFKR